MGVITRAEIGAMAMTTLMLSSVVCAPIATSEPEEPSPATETSEPTHEELHNVIYRARIDGISRGATITYAAQDDQIQTANPTMVPGRIFEAMTVLPITGDAHMRVSIDWPYSANLHCEILVDNALVAQADDFISPRLTPADDDPDYGALQCQAPVNGLANAVPDELLPAEPDELLPAGPDELFPAGDSEQADTPH